MNPADRKPTSRKKLAEQGQSSTRSDRTGQQGEEGKEVVTHIKI
jgi:hypothetical protein